MWSKLAAVLESLQSGFLKKVLTGAGLALASSTAYKLYFDNAISQFIATANTIPSTTASLLHKSGFDQGMLIIVTSILISLSLNSSKVFLKKSS
ncbi:DUF2523 family protein [Acinetobacter sp. ANC 4641]|uniref:DUF2523 family protein n=1 Tax=Acinetobacter sp. ANC 4641 TaxID=2529847 RepID=UPI00103C4CA9|nr:DUF2523 family protein [Acinetobacter sp. ANC 4641]TCB05665.1 DUF2523 domain-containing protein [Acinetobacter sp. ANC 4641]